MSHKFSHPNSSIFLCFLASFCACASPQKLSFDDFVQLKNTAIHASHVAAALGQPGKKLNIPSEGLVWTYFEKNKDGERQRLNIVVDPRTEELISATWVFSPSEELTHLPALEKALGLEGGFKVRSHEKRTSTHSWDVESQAENEKAGIVALLYPKSRQVMAVSFSPRPKRSAAGRENP